MTHAVCIRHGPYGRAAILHLDRPLVLHAHLRPHLLFHLGGADARFCVSDRLLPLGRSSGVFVDSWQPHQYPHAPGAAASRILALYLDPQWFAAHADPARFDAARSALRVTPEASRWIAVLAHELGEYEDGHSGVLDLALRELLSALAWARSPGPVTNPDAHSEASPMDRRIRRTVAYLHEHVGERIEFERIASDAGLSRPHFFELFRRELGLTPNVYWNMLRMESAITQLADTRVAVGEVAANLGFSAQSNFTRFFRDIQGVAPAEYRAARIQTHS